MIICIYVCPLSCGRADAEGSGISRIRLSPFYEQLFYYSMKFRFKDICVFVSSNWGPSTVHVKQQPWSPLKVEVDLDGKSEMMLFKPDNLSKPE